MKEIPLPRALTNKQLLGAGLEDPNTWLTWRAVLTAASGLPLDATDTQLFLAVAGNRAPPSKRVRELWCIAGLRSGKSKIAAALAVYFAVFVKHKLSIGEVGMVLCLAESKDQARVVFGYVKGFLEASPVLRQEVADVTRTEIRLRSGIIIAIHTNSFRTIPGRTLCACVFDEVAKWRSEESATPDSETYTAVLPALLTTKGMLVGISTGYRRMGLLYQKHRDHFGIDDNEVLVVQGPTTAFNSTLTEADIAPSRSADPSAAVSEWDGLFRDDVSTFLDDELVDRAVEHGRPLELPPLPGLDLFYRAFTDPSGGVGSDSYTFSIAHKEGDAFVIDVVRGTKGKYDPVTVTQEYAALCAEYHIGSVTGDNYAAQWVQGAWRDAGVSYVRSELPKSQLYLEVLPLFARGLVKLPDHPKLLRELRLLECHTHRSGKDHVDHPKGGHDDYANAVCGCLRTLSNYLGFSLEAMLSDGDDDDSLKLATIKAARLRAFMRGQPDQNPEPAHPTLSNDELLRISQPGGLII